MPNNFLTYDDLATLIAAMPTQAQTNLPPGSSPVQTNLQNDGSLIPSKAYPTAVYSMAVAFGFFSALLVIAIGLAVMMIWDLWLYWAYIICLAALVGLVSASGAGIIWTLNLAGLQGLTRPKVITETIVSDAPPVEIETVVHYPGDVLQLASKRIIEIHFLELIDATRPECEARGIGQDHWNITNEGLKQIGLKGERRWLTGITFDLAVRRWNDGIRIHDDGSMWAWKENGWKKIILP